MHSFARVLNHMEVREIHLVEITPGAAIRAHQP
jgi:hypothetical protein